MHDGYRIAHFMDEQFIGPILKNTVTAGRLAAPSETRGSMSSTRLLKDCLSPEPLHSGHEYKLCPAGFLLNLQHAEAQSRESAANAKMNGASGASVFSERFEDLKAAVGERHNAIVAQFDHVKDCFVCSMAFGLTPEVTPTGRAPFIHLLAKFSRLVTQFML
ncbi:MAG TPA: hypothetical protein VMA71_07790 [Alloacidobacterium sp.]|nr:hypothetical protein [Alloacidobacterium sp.]